MDSANVFYVGDDDPAGVLIDQSIEAELRKHLPPGFPLEFHRLAVNAAQVAEYDLTHETAQGWRSAAPRYH